MNTRGREPQLLSGLFPSLSRDIGWKVGAVSRVRYAAPKARALDTAPTFQPNPTEKKAKGRSANWNHLSGNTGGRPHLPPKPNHVAPPALAYCGQKMVIVYRHRTPVNSRLGNSRSRKYQ